MVFLAEGRTCQQEGDRLILIFFFNFFFHDSAVHTLVESIIKDKQVQSWVG